MIAEIHERFLFKLSDSEFGRNVVYRMNVSATIFDSIDQCYEGKSRCIRQIRLLIQTSRI